MGSDAYNIHIYAYISCEVDQEALHSVKAIQNLRPSKKEPVPSWRGYKNIRPIQKLIIAIDFGLDVDGVQLCTCSCV